MGNFIKKHFRLVVIFSICILLFLGGVRMNPVASLMVAVVDSLWLTLYMYMLDKYFVFIHNKRVPRFVHMLASFPLLSLMVTILLYSESLGFHYILHLEEPAFKPLIYPIFRCTMLVMGTFIGSLAHQSSLAEKKTEEMKKEKQEMELQLIRSQMDPHFVFNALNSIYSLSYTKKETAPQMILQLAEMLRYITDDCRSDKVPLEKEVKYIQNYLDFMRIRISCESKIQFLHQIDDTTSFLPPMLLQPFVENCFKHGDLQTNPQGWVRVEMKCAQGQLTLITENTMSDDSPSDQREGIGLANVQRRLQLYYPASHTLQLNENDHVFSTLLQIKL